MVLSAVGPRLQDVRHTLSDLEIHVRLWLHEFLAWYDFRNPRPLWGGSGLKMFTMEDTDFLECQEKGRDSFQHVHSACLVYENGS